MLLTCGSSTVGVTLHGRRQSAADKTPRLRKLFPDSLCAVATRTGVILDLQSRSHAALCNSIPGRTARTGMEGPAKYALESFGFEGKCVLITGGSSGKSVPCCSEASCLTLKPLIHLQRVIRSHARNTCVIDTRCWMSSLTHWKLSLTAPNKRNVVRPLVTRKTECPSRSDPCRQNADV